MLGQIPRTCVPGQKIYEICKQSDVNVIVDIGTWNGMGTTKCIYDAIIDSGKKNFKVFSIECAKHMYEQAKQNLLPLNNFMLIHGSLIDAEELYPMYEMFKTDSGATGWLNDDVRYIKAANNNVFNQMPSQIDFLIIDGGEFSGEIEFKKLYLRSRYIFLHDTTSFKNKNNRQFILDNPKDFEIIFDDVAETALICKHITK
jgi:hypothetical protein